jgi:hypothetical protein
VNIVEQDVVGEVVVMVVIAPFVDVVMTVEVVEVAEAVVIVLGEVVREVV